MENLACLFSRPYFLMHAGSHSPLVSFGEGGWVNEHCGVKSKHELAEFLMSACIV